MKRILGALAMETLNESPGRLMLFGAVVCGLYTLAYMWANGIVMDQVVEPAQVIAGQVVYPEGHPHDVFSRKAFSLTNYLGAAFLTVLPDLWVLSASRNFLFLFLSAFTPYAVCALLSRSALWGLAATALTLSEAHLRLNSTYPMRVFPDFSSDGHIGLHLGILVVALLLSRCWKTGGFLLGLLPALHATMAVVVWPWSACYFLLRMARRPLSKQARHFLLATFLGLGVTAAFGLALTSLSVGTSVPPYDQVDRTGDDLSVYRTFTATTDVHRQDPKLHSFGYLVAPAAYFGLCFLLLGACRKEDRDGVPDQAKLLMLLGVLVWAVVYGSFLLRLLMPSFPVWVEAVMPTRFPNFTTTLLPPLAMAGIAHAVKHLEGAARSAALAMVVGILALEGILFRVDPARLANHILFLVLGLAFAANLYAFRPFRARRLGILLAAALLGGVILTLSFSRGGPVWLTFWGSFALGCAWLWSSGRLPSASALSTPAWSSRVRAWVLAAAVAALVSSIWSEKLWDRIGRDVNPIASYLESSEHRFDQRFRQWLRENGGPAEMILAPIFPHSEFQIRVGHPVLMVGTTLYMMSYMPSLAPSVGMMARDLYGVDYSNQGQIRTHSVDGRMGLNSPVWQAEWEARDAAAWQALGEKYRFRLVVSTSRTKLRLPVAIEDDLWTLYVIPSLEVVVTPDQERGHPVEAAGTQ